MIPTESPEMNVNKVWLFHQGQWEVIDAPDKNLPSNIESPISAMHYDTSKPEVYGIEPHYSVYIYKRAIGLDRPLYSYYVEMEVQGFTRFFYIADFPSYLQIVPQLIDQVDKALRLAQLVKQVTETKPL